MDVLYAYARVCASASRTRRPEAFAVSAFVKRNRVMLCHLYNIGPGSVSYLRGFSQMIL